MKTLLPLFLIISSLCYAEPDKPKLLNESINSFSLTGNHSAYYSHGQLSQSTHFWSTYHQHFSNSYSFDLGLNSAIFYTNGMDARIDFDIGLTKYFISDNSGPYVGFGINLDPNFYPKNNFNVNVDALSKIGYLYQIVDKTYFDLKHKLSYTLYAWHDITWIHSQIFLGITQYF